MSFPAPRRSFTFREYLELEEASNVKHEFFAGEIYAMAGGTPEHAALSVAVSSALFEQLAESDCRVYSSDLRIRVVETGLATYPDVTVVCGPLEHDPESRTTIVNPTVVIEVTSPSTDGYDRGEKLDHYQRIPSLRECVLVAHDARRVDVWRRTEGDHWSRETFAGGTPELPSVHARLDVDQIYDRAGL